MNGIFKFYYTINFHIIIHTGLNCIVSSLRGELQRLKGSDFYIYI
jgi:hypothetical protein